MDVLDFALLFVLGFIIGLFGRLIYARMTGRLEPENLRDERNVRYIDTALNQKSEAPDELEQPQEEDKKAASQ